MGQLSPVTGLFFPWLVWTYDDAVSGRGFQASLTQFFIGLKAAPTAHTFIEVP